MFQMKSQILAMNKQHIFTQIIPDYRRTMQDDRYPLKLKITY